MKCTKIEAHIVRDLLDNKVRKTIVAFNQRYHLVGIRNLTWNKAIATYLPEEKI